MHEIWGNLLCLLLADGASNGESTPFSDQRVHENCMSATAQSVDSSGEYGVQRIEFEDESYCGI